MLNFKVVKILVGCLAIILMATGLSRLLLNTEVNHFFSVSLLMTVVIFANLLAFIENQENRIKDLERKLSVKHNSIASPIE